MTMITPNAAFLFGLLTLAATFGFPIAPPDTPFFCNLKALTSAERTEHRGLTEHLVSAVRATRETADGYTFELDPNGLGIKELATWVDFERRCCPFFDFHLEWRRENGPVTLQLTGRAGVKEFMLSEFKAAFR